MSARVGIISCILYFIYISILCNATFDEREFTITQKIANNKQDGREESSRVASLFNKSDNQGGGHLVYDLSIIFKGDAGASIKDAVPGKIVTESGYYSGHRESIVNIVYKSARAVMTVWDFDRDFHGHSRWLILIGCCALIYVTFWMPGCYGAKREKELEFVKGGRICIGTNGRMSVPSNREHHYRNLRDRYTNCTYVDGNLELTWLQDENLDLLFLKDIREVTGYVLISHVDVKRIVLPSLQIIRGRTLFKLSVHDEEFALMVTLSKMHNLEMPALRDILTGNVGLFNNFNLCHMKTIRWDEILTGHHAKHVYVYNFTEPERECPPCDPTCREGCWGEGADNCQKFSKINCSPQCHQGRCFGMRPRECCHLFCAGGCTGPKQSDCLACRNFYDDGVCKQECPQMVKYNPITYSWEANPDGKYAYGATCVKNCPEHLLKDNGACVRACPQHKKPVNGECKPCDGPCPKTCKALDQAVHSGNIDSYKDCTIIEGSLMILESSFQGFQHIYPNFTFGPRFNKMHPDKLQVFSTLREVTGYINIQASHPAFRNLSYFRNLKVIGGRELTEYFSALYIVKTTLQSLDLRSLESIRSGSVAILENKELCFAEAINWRKLMRNEQAILLQNNKPVNECTALNLTCHPQCSKEGCWGVGINECLSCANYRLGDTCIESCDLSLGLYNSGNKICGHCHEECEETCNGPGPANCTKCKHVIDGPNCLAECPALKYNGNGRCLPCHENCIDGCSGPGKFVGEGGCKSCERAIIKGRDKYMTVECFNNTPTCPDGYFSDIVSPQETGILEPLKQKSVCRQCHRRCKKCTSYGFHLSACKECAHFKHNEHCEDSCPFETYADNITRQCLPCSPECRGCSGPGPTQCDTCKNYKIVMANNSSQFNCTTTCPSDMPYKYYPSEEDVPLCTNIEPESATGKEKEETQYLPILLGVLGCIMLLGLFLALLGYQCWQRAKSKENTVKMTMRMTGYESDEPLKPSNVKPNLAKLRIVKEAELRRGGILGYGAFGTVYKGVWVPEGENIKIPVAIKVLREGTGTNANKEILEEAYIMASVEHPHLLQLLSVCMTSQMMLVTQLMPLGCLLDYVRNNKDKIGSKPLLNWCTQIAKGMSYLEERRLVHRDLAARNVLVQTPKCVKITDFGLAKLLDINEDEYKAAGGKMPIKWLALECIQHRIFTHKSDVWAFGVTVWELLTYGGRPYETVPAREVPDLLEKGERLPQPSICTIDVYMIMIKCWMLDAESRPNFKELGDEFAKMARDPGRYLVIPGDKLMRLPSYTPQDEKELIRNLSVATEGPEIIMDAEEYLQPKIRAPSSVSGSHTPPLPSPIKPIDMGNQWMIIDTVDGRLSNRSPQMRPRPDRKYSHLEAAAANSPNLHGRDLSNSRYSSDPLKLLNRDMEVDEDPLTNGLPVFGLNKDDVKIRLPNVDEDDYLMPSVTNNPNASTYMDLIGDNKLSGDLVNGNRLEFDPRFKPATRNAIAMDNPEYHIMSNGITDPTINGRPRRKNTSSEDDSDHEYYNDYERLQKELQPLNHKRNETTV